MSNIKIIAKNRKARFNFEIIEAFEAGIELKGTEVKSIRQAKINISEGYASIDNGEVILKQVHISPYEQGNIFNVDPVRPRKLLLHKKEISRLIGETTQKGYTLVPLSVYLKRGLVKVELGICRGKAQEDKRETIKRREADLEARRAISKHYRG